nr:response regulator [Rhodococcus sp. (in: high G+C Gram-positive bacteria)]
MKPSDVSCLIVDDSTEFCVAARRLLDAAGFTVVGIASTMADAVAVAAATRPDVILVDIDLGAESGFDVVAALGDAWVEAGLMPAPSMIMVSTHDAEDFADLVDASAAVGFLSKFDLSADTIIELLDRSR